MELGVAKQRLVCSLSKCSDWIRDGGSDLHCSVACLLEIHSGSVPKSAISFFSTVVALSGSLALETCVICLLTDMLICLLTGNFEPAAQFFG